MGLFSKKTCTICGKKLGMLDNKYQIADGQLLCTQCRKKLSRDLSMQERKQMSRQDVLDCMAFYAQKEQEFARFSKTDSLLMSFPPKKTAVCFDDVQHLWSVGEEKECFSFSQIKQMKLVIETNRDDVHTDWRHTDWKNAGERECTNIAEEYILPREEFPLPEPGFHVCEMTIEVTLEHPWLTHTDIPVMRLLGADQDDTAAGYDRANEILTAMEQRIDRDCF